MKRFLQLLILIGFCAPGVFAQTVTITFPAGLEYPYEVPAGTAVTFKWEYSEAPTAFYTHTEEPVFPEFGPDPAWTQYTNFVDNGDGTYSITLTIQEPVFVWGGAFSSWIGQWRFSDRLEIGIASGVRITAPDALLCPGGSDTETLQVSGTFASYQWYFNNEPINGATAATYPAHEEGYYKVQVPLDGKMVFSNTQRIRNASIAMTGELTAANKLTLTASAGMTTYQWWSGPAANSLSPIASAQAATYTATLTSASVYYAVKGTVAGCEIQSEARPASLAKFKVPTITVDAPANEFGNVCPGTIITLSVPAQYATYEWYRDGDPFSFGEPSTLVLDDEGDYSVKVTPAEWPEVTITSPIAPVEYFSVIQPLITGLKNYPVYCAGETVELVLADEGYTYDWYVHTKYNYTEDDKVNVPGYTYTFGFTEATYVTVVARYLGCETSTRLRLESYANAMIYPEVSDPDQLFLCPGSTLTMSLPSDQQSEYVNLQWYKLTAGEYQPIDGKTTASLAVTAIGTYALSAQSKACASVTIMSEPIEVRDYSERELFIYTDKPTLCVGEATMLNISDEWNSIQWFKKKISITNHGYEASYVPLTGGGTSTSQSVNEFTTYQVKAKHKSCAAGLKTTSEPFQIVPTVNPDIMVEPNEGIHRWPKAPYDSIPNYLYCSEAPLTLSLPDGYDSYKWRTKSYTGDGDYAPGDLLEGETGQSVDIIAFGAKWYTAEVELEGCVGYSHGILIDTYVHNTPAVESRSNSELCGEGDSTLLNVAFYGDWVKYEWYRDGELIPDSDNDSLYAKVAGGYTVTGYPEDCPHIGYSSGLPVPVSQFPKAWIEENEDVIYAMPELGFYSYQWYLDGEPLEPGEYPHVLFKSEMRSGTYTVEVTNPDECSSLSDGYVWTVTGIEENKTSAFVAYPNPTNGPFVLKGLEEGRIRSVNIYNAQGLRIEQYEEGRGSSLNLSSHPVGIYVLEITLQDGTKHKTKIIRH